MQPGGALSRQSGNLRERICKQKSTTLDFKQIKGRYMFTAILRHGTSAKSSLGAMSARKGPDECTVSCVTEKTLALNQQNRRNKNQLVKENYTAYGSLFYTRIKKKERIGQRGAHTLNIPFVWI